MTLSHRLAASMRGMGLGEDDAQGANPDGMVNSIMRQLLSKDVLHQSMKARPGADAACHLLDRHRVTHVRFTLW